MRTKLDMLATITDGFELLNDQLIELEKYFYRREFLPAYRVLQNISNTADNMAGDMEPFTKTGNQ